MASGPVSYGSALRAASAVRLSSYDEETIVSFIADLFGKEFNDVQRDVHIVSASKGGSRPSSVVRVVL